MIPPPRPVRSDESPAITPLRVPAGLIGAEADEFHAFVALHNAICASDFGTDDFSRTAEEMLPQWQTSADHVNCTFLARSGDRILGAVNVEYATAETTSADIDLMVLPEQWGRGVEQALLDAAEAHVRALGRKVMQAWTLHRPESGADAIVAATGVGRVAGTPHTALLLEAGFTLEQVERISAFDLQVDPAPLELMLAEALAAAGDDYRLLEWTLPTPPPLRDGYAWALSRMTTDAPSGGLEVDEEIWDADRVARRDQRLLAGGQTMSVTAVEHMPTGALAAFNELMIGPDLGGVTHQQCTLVLEEHRGRRLGRAVKCANILRWRAIAPSSPRITTFNAAENRHMLEINEALGFTTTGHAAAWQRRLD